MNNPGIFQATTRIIFGEKSCQNAGEVLQGFQASNAFIITDAGLVKTGIVDRVREALVSSGIDVQVFDAVEADPSIETVEAAFGEYRKHKSDCIVAVGGGSPIDCAKGLGVLVSNPGKLEDYFGANKVTESLPPLIAIPTTVGTGSEVTQYAVISDLVQNKKKVIGSERIAPRAAILDPELVASLPLSLVSATAMDALTHAVEAVISVFASPFTDALGLEAIHQVNNWLPEAMRSPGLPARANLLYASTMAGQAFCYGKTGLVHGMAHPVGSYYHIHHGLAIAILLPYVLMFNLPACEGKLTRIAAAMGAHPDPEAAIQAVIELNKIAGIPSHLSEVGVTEQHLESMARDAFESGNAQVVNPRKPSYEEVLELYRQAL